LSTRPTVAALLANGLARAGVKWAFTVPGESFLGLLDALPEAGIAVVATRHEGGAAFMAEAVGQLTGRPAAVLGTRAVGAANMSIGIHTARQNSTPLVAVLGQVRRDRLGREAFQEVDLSGSFGLLAKWAAQIGEPADAARLIGEGLSAALSGRPGPVLFAVPEDVLEERIDQSTVDVQRSTPPAPDRAPVEAVIKLLAEAERPVILAGGGVIASNAGKALVQLSERLHLPVIASWRRPTAFPNDHPNYLGMTGFGAARTVLARLEEADALLVLGSRLSEVTTFDYRVPSDTTRWAHVDLEPRMAGHGLRDPDISIAADVAAFLDAALETAGEGAALPERLTALAADRDAYVAASTLDDEKDWRGAGVTPAHVVNTLQRVLPQDSIVTTDAGNFGLWAARGLRFGPDQAFLGPTSGAMGYGLPAAIAASLVEPERAVIALCGDGGFAMTMNELETAVRAQSSPVILVFDNRRYGTIAMYQQREGMPTTGTELGPIDFAAVARACGAQGGRVARNAEFEPALRDALAARRPAVIHLEMDPRWVTPDG
jgi:acetolactate synthase-1/2/3 large subunit